MWWSFRKPNWKHFEMAGGGNWILRRRILEALGTTLQLGILGASVGALVLSTTGHWDEFLDVTRSALKRGLASYHALMS
jgi:hypothetical protein